MKVALLAAANSIHTIRWANGLAEQGIEIHLISAHALRHDLDKRVVLHLLPVKAPLGYVFSARALRRILRRIRPDILNAHYATGYGSLARLSWNGPSLLSVWGSDVYDFPLKSIFHRWLLRGNLMWATAIGSTSQCMLKKTAETFKPYLSFVTPFGIDEDRFHPATKVKDDRVVVVGTIKTLSAKYGIDTLIQAFALVRRKVGDKIDVKLEISGSGPDKQKFELMVQRLGIADKVIFHGNIQHDSVPSMLHRMDIYVALSRLDSESFGVAILEASACATAVVVSDADGPAEVTIDGRTGFIVPRNKPEAAAEALINLIEQPELRDRMGNEGRHHVLNHYTWSHSIDLMLRAYSRTIEFYRENQGE